MGFICEIDYMVSLGYMICNRLEIVHKICTISILCMVCSLLQLIILISQYTPRYILQYPEKKIGHIKSFFELEADDIDKKTIKFDEFKGKVTVITNVASHCGKYIFVIWLYWIINI